MICFINYWWITPNKNNAMASETSVSTDQPGMNRRFTSKSDCIMQLRLFIRKKLAHFFLMEPGKYRNKNELYVNLRKLSNLHYRHLREKESRRAANPLKSIRKFVSETQRKENKSLSAYLAQAMNPVSVINEFGFIEWVNEGFTALSGYTLAESQGKTWELFRQGKEQIVPEETFRKLKEKKVLSFEFTGTHKDDKQNYWTLATLTPLLNKEGIADKMLIVESDITALKIRETEFLLNADKTNNVNHQIESELLEMKQHHVDLEKATDSKKIFFSTISHEIRTPLNGIIGLTEFLLKADLNPEQRELLSAIKHSGDGLLVVINDVLDLSRLENGKMNFQQIPFRLSEILNTVIHIFRSKAFEKSIGLRIDVSDWLPDALIGDPVRLKQILMNLISNAIKFTRQGEVLLQASTGLSSSGLFSIQFTVTDTGVGIPEKDLDHIFDEYTQLRQFPDSSEGSGLGLAIAKRLVELQGGQITVKSILGIGSMFKVNLPFSQLTPEADLIRLIGSPEILQKKEPEMKGLRVLMAEDNKVNQLFGEKTLQNEDACVDLAENGLEALKKLEAKEYDILLLDVRMPVMDGYEAASLIRKNKNERIRTIPIVALSASDEPGEAEKCIAAGMNAFVLKPFTSVELIEKMMFTLMEARNPKQKNI
jgi:PAS domain S-box-containing protein